MAAFQISLYKLDKDKVDLVAYPDLNERSNERKPLAEYIQAIVDKHNGDIEREESSAKKYTPTTSGHRQEVGGVEFITYHTQLDNNSHPWNSAFVEQLGLNGTVYENVASFFEVDGEIFAISAGHGVGLFARYIDGDFPIQVAQRIMHPNPTSANERIVAGNVFGRTQSFRRQQAISASRNISSVWQSLGGKLIESVVEEPAFKNMFNRETKVVNADFSGYILIKKSIEVQRLPQLAKWLLEKFLTPLTEDQRRGFDYLNCLEKISRFRDKDFINRLNCEYAGYLLKEQPDKHAVEVDFAHSRYNDFLLATSFKIFGHGGEPVEFAAECVYNSESAPFVLSKLRDYVNEIKGDEELDDEGMYELLKDINMEVQTGDAISSFHSSIMNYFQGEFTYEGITYFRIDNNWYRASSSFIEVVNEEFEKLLREDFFRLREDENVDILPSEIGVTNEGKYNRSYDKIDDCIVTDKLLADGIEIADIIRITNEGKIHIYHNKYGFGASMRDVCSQLSLSMSIISQILDSQDSGREILDKYYETIKKKYTTGEYKNDGMTLKFSKEDFKEAILSARKEDFIFILGCIDDIPISVDRGSNIAKFESIGITKVEAPNYGFKLKIVRISNEGEL